MQYGICPLSIVPVRLLADDTSTMVTQLLYGEHFRILEQRKNWSRIRNAFDSGEGWIQTTLYTEITEEAFEIIESSEAPKWCTDLVAFVLNGKEMMIPVLLGSSVAHTHLLAHRFEGDCSTWVRNKARLGTTAALYLNAPHLSGGKTPFGIDSPGLTQMVYKMNGYSLFRDATAQSAQGEALSFIEESEEGDLAFFDNEQGTIDHVGIILRDNLIIHADEKVRIDSLDHTGIFNRELNRYTHQLRVIKKMI